MLLADTKCESHRRNSRVLMVGLTRHYPIGYPWYPKKYYPYPIPVKNDTRCNPILQCSDACVFFSWKCEFRNWWVAASWQRIPNWCNICNAINCFWLSVKWNLAYYVCVCVCVHMRACVLVAVGVHDQFFVSLLGWFWTTVCWSCRATAACCDLFPHGKWTVVSDNFWRMEKQLL